MTQAIYRKDFERAVDDFKEIMDSILQADRLTYLVRVKELVNFIEGNHIIKHFVNPFLNMPIEIKQVIPQWGVFKLPSNNDEQIAFVIKLFYAASQEKCSLEICLYEAFMKQNFDENYYAFNRAVVKNCYNKILRLLNDYLGNHYPLDIEKAIKASVVHVNDYSTKNHYEIRDNNQSNIVAGGDGNIQNIKIGFTDRVVADLIKLHNLNDKQVEELKPALKILEQEDKKETTDTSLLQKTWETIYSIGGKVALGVTVRYLTQPELIKSSATYLMSLL